MIKANELRLGNWVQPRILANEYPIDCIHSDETIRILRDGESIGCYYLRIIDPIPITEEWLLKFGFEDDTVVFALKNLWLAEGDYGYDVWLHGLANGKTTKVEYVHQLQNLYFALTGTELTIKENVQA